MAIIRNTFTQTNGGLNDNEFLVHSTSASNQWRYDTQPGQPDPTEQLQNAIQELEAEVQIWDSVAGRWRPLHSTGEGEPQHCPQIGEIPEVDTDHGRAATAREAL